MAAQRAPTEHSAPREDAADRDAQAHEPIDADSIRGALSGTTAADAAEGGHASLLQSLHDRAESAFTASEPGQGVRAQVTWSVSRQFAFIVLASALCWAAVLAPVLLIF